MQVVFNIVSKLFFTLLSRHPSVQYRHRTLQIVNLGFVI